MKRYILRSITALFFTALAVAIGTGCEDKLNALPGDKQVYGSIIVDQPTAEIALNGVYYQLANSGSSADEELTTQWGTYHELMPASASGVGMYAYGPMYLEQHDRVVASDYTPEYMWAYGYKIVNAANGVLDQIAEVADSKFDGNRKAEIIAEARWIRAYGHFFLLSWFGENWDTSSSRGVIIRDQFVTVHNLTLPRSSVAETYAIILGDIEDAITNAPEENPNHYVNKWVAKALKARVLMMRGEGDDYQEVISITRDIIDNGPYSLETNLEDIFFTKGLKSEEVMFGIYPYPTQAGHGKTYLSRNASGNVSISFVITLEFEELLQGDPRADWILGEETVNAYFYTFYPDGTYDLERKERMNVNKYQYDAKEDCYCLRLTEMYLLNAEATLRSGGSVDQARDRIKEVKTRAGVTDFTALDAITDRDQMLRELWNEWAMNMCFEDGQEWFALLRFPLSVIQEIKPAMTSDNYRILPIPAKEFEKNPAIKGTQNPGYTEN